MAKRKQKTLGGTAGFTGIALHTGRRVKIYLHPAPENSGIIFRRIDLDGKPEIPADIDHVIDTQRGTTIADGDAQVHTVEHLLAAFTAFGIDNAVVDMTGPEPPVADGSAEPFVELLRETGAKRQQAVKPILEVTEPVFYENDETRVVALPHDRFSIACTVKYNQTPLDCQFLSLDVNKETFCNELAKARTFCLFHEIEALIKANLICGGSLDNAVVIKGNAILSREGLRYADEFVRHKILDMVGDLTLLKADLKARFIAIKPGHQANIKIAEEIVRKSRELVSK
ncbi:MAG: UDP-3-O-acyl-N-acetylglucosamine deacetylase [Verrucomicrobiota bacterium]